MNRSKVLISYLKMKKGSIGFFLFCIVAWCGIGYLSNITFSEMSYTILIWLFLGSVYFLKDSYAYLKRYQQLVYLQHDLAVNTYDFPKTNDMLEQMYQEMLKNCVKDKCVLFAKAEQEKKDMVEYYSMWVHQIKTPIAGMSLLLQATECEERETLQGELFRIEQYVDMVLSYIRLNGDTNDFVIKAYDVDKIIKQALKKFASQFIYKKISLCMDEIEGKVYTDAKWLGFVIEQLLSKALKYTEQGSVSIVWKICHVFLRKDILGTMEECIKNRVVLDCICANGQWTN